MISIGFYRRQFVFFVLLASLLFGIGWLVSNQQSEAAGRPVVFNPDTTRSQLEIILKDQGRAVIAGVETSGVIHFLRDYDEFRYLLIDEPMTHLDEVVVRMGLPRPLSSAAVESWVIITHNESVSYQTAVIDPTTIEYHLFDLGPGATVTLVAELPKGTVLPSVAQRLFGTIRSLPHVIWLTLALILPFVSLLVLGSILFGRVRQERFFETNDERPTPPELLPPAVVTALVSGRVSARAIGATVLDLASREYLEIGSHEQTYTFTKRRELLGRQTTRPLAEFEQALVLKLFAEKAPQTDLTDVRVRIGTSLFSREVAQIYAGVYDRVTEQGYFLRNPLAVQGTYRLFGLALFFLGLFGFGFGTVFFSEAPTPLLFWVGMIISALIIISLAPHLPSYTNSGLRMREEWLKFRNYLESQKPISYAAVNQEQFYTYLPYAVALGVEVEWAGRFIEEPFHLPDWYLSKTPLIRLEDFANDLFPMVGFLARELAAAKIPTLS